MHLTSLSAYPVLPNPFHGSTTFNSKIKSYDHLAQRVRRTLGEPLIEIEVSSEQMYEFIDIAIEWFTKYSGVTEEYLIFRSDLYKNGVGLRIDSLFSITPEFYNSIDTTQPTLSAGFDFDMGDYRKVVDVFSVEQGNSSGVNTLFTIEHTVAQQAYFGHLLGNVGYDLITWNALKEWLDLRQKLLALKPYFRFDPDTQILKLIPEPNQANSYYGLIGCRVQKPIKFLISQLWVFRYVSALTKIQMGHTRGKYNGTILFGGQSVNYQDVMSQGLKEKDELEKELMSNYVDTDPVRFFIG
jgi:hypothetical protein